MKIIIRRADGYDADMIGRLLEAWLDETELNYPGICPYSHLWLAHFIYNNPCYVAVIAGEIVGTIGMRLGTFPWNNEHTAFFCDFLIVDKQHRANGAAYKLIDEVKRLSDETKVPVFLGIMTGHLAKEKDRFLSMCGLEYAGGNFVYNV